MRPVALCLIVALSFAGAARGQEASLNIPPQVLTIDQDRLFAETRPGATISDELEAQARALADENAQIEADLVARERQLTEDRPGMEPGAFRELADAFDAEVQRIRAEQDQKAREINRARDLARQQFFNEVADVISEIVRERGALIVLDRRDVFLSADRIDITDDAIERVNANAE